MTTKNDITNAVNDFFSGKYDITDGNVVPDVADIKLGKFGREMELAMLFIDIRESTKIVDGFRRETAARMYKSFLWGITKIAKNNSGDIRSFNGDGALVVFGGGSKRTNAVKAALQMKWFCKEILKPKVDSYLKDNKKLQNLDFNFGIGVDVGEVLIVRGGIKGENNNDLVWVGNATNYSVKLSSLSKDGYHVYISKRVYDGMLDSSKFGGEENKNMWEEREWTAMNKETIYRSHWQWSVS